MPIYEYECDKCGYAFEREQRMSDPPVKTCPKCRGRKVTKLISRSSFVLKGGGWYADGYSDSKKGKSSDAGSSSEASSGSAESSTTSSTSGEGKSESKPAKTSTKDTKAKASSKSAA